VLSGPEKRVRPWLFVIAVLLGLGACGRAARPDAPLVQSVEIRGASQVPASELKGRILTAEDSWLPFTRDKTYDAGIWRTDLRRIERYYQARGFYQARVVSDTVTPLDNKGVKLEVQVEEGAPTVISEVRLDGVEALPEAARSGLQREIPFRPGDTFLEEPWQGAAATVERPCANAAMPRPRFKRKPRWTWKRTAHCSRCTWCPAFATALAKCR
jgi:translocation and assembly module TamA